MQPALPRSIRIGARDDIPQIAAVVNAASAMQAPFFAGPRTSEAELESMPDHGVFLVAEGEGGKIIAAVFVKRDGSDAYFGMLAVDPSHQRRGLGLAMVAAAEDYGRSLGAHKMNITVLSLREELLPYYDRLGYEIVGTAEFHPPPSRPLKDGLQCHKILLSKKL